MEAAAEFKKNDQVVVLNENSGGRKILSVNTKCQGSKCTGPVH